MQDALFAHIEPSLRLARYVQAQCIYALSPDMLRRFVRVPDLKHIAYPETMDGA